MILIRDIQSATAEEYGIHPEIMLGRRKRYSESHPRQAAIYLSTCLTTHSYIRIGQFFNKDHSTVIHAVRSVRKRLATDTTTEEALRRIMRRVLA